jgi:hypothetical protein
MVSGGMSQEIPHHYTGRIYRAGDEWAWVIEDGGCVVMRGGGCQSEHEAVEAVNVELKWLDPETNR